MKNQYPTDLSGISESYRLQYLQQYNILDSAPETAYNDIAILASLICEAPIALITFIDARRQWIKSSAGVSVTEMDRTHAFCTHAIQHPKELMIVEDCNKDIRFQANPFVAGEPYLAFYAGMPLTNKQGYALGTICVLDTRPRSLTARQAKALKLFSVQLMHMLELRRIQYEHETLQAQLQNGSGKADEHIRLVTSQIRQSLSDLVSEKDQCRGYGTLDNNDLPLYTQTMERIEINIKALIEKMLSHYP